MEVTGTLTGWVTDARKAVISAGDRRAGGLGESPRPVTVRSSRLRKIPPDSTLGTCLSELLVVQRSIWHLTFAECCAMPLKGSRDRNGSEALRAVTWIG